ncbi:MAG: NADH-quinone oxidoreductase subunit J [Chloroflexi bacterium]|nr:NADH-quinone oxidoreductase subunit J [Chloroflexota bacterium]
MITDGAAFAFWVLAVGTCLAALSVVLLRNIFHAALLLVLTFTGVAGIYIVLSADFLAGVQLLIYAGAISILIIFAVMLTRRPVMTGGFSRFSISAAIVAVTLVIALIWVTVGLTDWSISSESPIQPTTAPLANALFDRTNGWVLPFEVASIVLLAAMIGAIAIVKDK